MKTTLAQDLTNARRELYYARINLERMRQPRGKGDAGDAAEKVEFWGNKVTMLDAMLKSPQFAGQ